MASYPSSIPRCQHIKINGTQCGSPALKRSKFCFFHKKWRDTHIAINARRARRAAIDLPVLEDANSIQIALMQVMRLIASGQLDSKTAGLLLYALQTASSNLGRTSFEPRPRQVVIDPRAIDETCLGENAWENEDFEEDEEEDEELEPDDEADEPAAKVAPYDNQHQKEPAQEDDSAWRRNYRMLTKYIPRSNANPSFLESGSDGGGDGNREEGD
jgi:hypothetical protein